MRTHKEIVQGVGASVLGRELRAAGIEVKPTTPQRWADRNSIPGEYWAAIAELGHASLDELADAASAAQRIASAEAPPQNAAA